MKKPLEFINVGNDLQGNRILEINGEHYFYVDGERGESNGADHIWRAKSGNRLALLGPDYDYAELTPPAVNQGTWPIDPMTNSTVLSMQDDPTSDSWGAQNVFDVFTKAQGTGLGVTEYREW